LLQRHRPEWRVSLWCHSCGRSSLQAARQTWHVTCNLYQPVRREDEGGV
jgi:hypothetical protein